MNPSNSRMLIIAGLAVVLLLIVVLGLAWLLWGWPPDFEVKEVWIK